MQPPLVIDIRTQYLRLTTLAINSEHAPIAGTKLTIIAKHTIKLSTTTIHLTINDKEPSIQEPILNSIVSDE